MRHGPHQSAQKSTRTGTGEFWMTSSNVTSSTGTGSASGGSGDLHAPQRPVLARCLPGTRFFRAQRLQTRITGIKPPPILITPKAGDGSLIRHIIQQQVEYLKSAVLLFSFRALEESLKFLNRSRDKNEWLRLERGLRQNNCESFMLKYFLQLGQEWNGISSNRWIHRLKFRFRGTIDLKLTPVYIHEVLYPKSPKW